MATNDNTNNLSSNVSTADVNPFEPTFIGEADFDDDLINMSNVRLELVQQSAGEAPKFQSYRDRDFANITGPTSYTVCSPSNSASEQISSLDGNHVLNGDLRPDQPFPTWYDSYNVSVNDSSDTDVPLLQSDDIAFIENAEDQDHCHSQRNNKPCVKVRNQLLISSGLCLTFMITEIIGGYMSNSLAIMADAAHMLSDLASFLISLFALWLGGRPPSKQMSFGYYRAEIIGALISVVLIWVLTGILVYTAVLRVLSQYSNIDANTMIIVAIIGIIFNIIMGSVLHTCCRIPHGHGLGHTHSHSHQVNQTHGIKSNINVRAAFIHVVGDLLQSIGVFVAACVIKFKPEYHLVDPICTFLFSAMVLVTTLGILKDAVHILMEGFPHDMNYLGIKADLEDLEGVKAVHSLHIWSLTVGKNALTVHLALDEIVNCHQIVKLANRLVRQKHQITHSTIQTELYEPATMTTCDQCLGP